MGLFLFWLRKSLMGFLLLKISNFYIFSLFLFLGLLWYEALLIFFKNS